MLSDTFKEKKGEEIKIYIQYDLIKINWLKENKIIYRYFVVPSLGTLRIAFEKCYMDTQYVIWHLKMEREKNISEQNNFIINQSKS